MSSPRAERAQRRKFAFLYSTPAYRPTLELCGYPGLQDELRRAVHSGDWEALGSVVSDEVLDEIQPSATYDELPALVTRRLSGLVSGFVLPPPDDPADDDRFRKVVAASPGHRLNTRGAIAAGRLTENELP